MANPDLGRIVKTVEIRTRPVVIARGLNGRTIRQYWERRKGQWKIVYEGVVG